MTAIAVSGSALADAAAWVARIIPVRPTQPILGGIVLTADGDQVRLSAYDYETAATVTVPAVVKEPGTLLLSGRLLAAVAKAIGRNVDATLEDAAGGAEIRSGRSEWTVPTMPLDYYPTLPVADQGVTATVDATQLRQAIARVLPAAQSELSNLSGVRIEPALADGWMTLTATDRWRLATVDIPLLSGTAPTVTVPAELVDAIARATDDGEVALSATDQVLGFATAAHTVVGRQIAEEYPPWRRLLPAPNAHHVTVAVADLAQAINQAQIMATAAEAPLVLRFDTDAVRVVVDGTDRRAQAEAAAELVGDPDEVRVKAAYLLAGLAEMQSERCRVHLYRTFVTLEPETDDDPYRHLVMHRRGRT